MVGHWVLFVGFLELMLSMFTFAGLFVRQAVSVKNHSVFWPLKWLLLATFFVLIIASLPLAFVYADVLWFGGNNHWIIPVAILSNASSKLILAMLLVAVYKFNLPGNE